MLHFSLPFDFYEPIGRIGVTEMAVDIFRVIKGSSSEKKGLRAGDTLISINGHEINDVLDFSFYAAEKNPILVYRRDGKIKKVKIRKAEDEDLGLEFETYLMDRHRHCKNKCVFCFIDQLPKGMRKSLYFKDDDSRLSFLFGNYITLTNITQSEADRIIKMRISPVNVSVHTMNPQLRVRMMGNPAAGESLRYLKLFADAGIEMNTQLVVCPGLNDGDELEYSLNELKKLGDSVKSIAVVPVGLSDHRQGLYELKAFDTISAGKVIDTIDAFNKEWTGEEKVAFAADEFFLLAEREMPGPEYYGDYPQLENGVGLWTSFREEFLRALSDEEYSSYVLENVREISIVTGLAAGDLIAELVDETVKKWHNLRVNIFRIKNIFFGLGVNVSGLITGQDILKQIGEKDLGCELLIPATTLRHASDVFLDDLKLEDLSQKLGLPVIPVEIDGEAFLKAILGL